MLSTGIFLSLFLLFITNCYADDPHVFLITGSKSEITQVSKHDLRRIYLGAISTTNLTTSNPILNKKDPEIYALFLKNIMHMTENGYKRKVVKRIFRQGGDKIFEIHDLNKLDQHLQEHPDDLCFIKKSDIKHMLNIKILKQLW